MAWVRKTTTMVVHMPLSSNHTVSLTRICGIAEGGNGVREHPSRCKVAAEELLFENLL